MCKHPARLHYYITVLSADPASPDTEVGDLKQATGTLINVANSLYLDVQFIPSNPDSNLDLNYYIVITILRLIGNYFVLSNIDRQMNNKSSREIAA